MWIKYFCRINCSGLNVTIWWISHCSKAGLSAHYIHPLAALAASLIWTGSAAQCSAHTHTCVLLTGQTQADSRGGCVNAESSVMTQWNSEGYKWGRWPYSLSVHSERMADWKTTRPFVRLHKVRATPANLMTVVSQRAKDDCSMSSCVLHTRTWMKTPHPQDTLYSLLGSTHHCSDVS